MTAAVGHRKKLRPLQQIQKLWAKLNDDGRKAHLEWTLKHCATCGREGSWEVVGIPDGIWCDACCDGLMRESLKEITKVEEAVP